jgi:tRNA/tmRNA/rRNA uracil-C5-methylase (TrmA/RlmC/RlmD family)
MDSVVTIERFADQGRCIAHIDGRVVFVRFALPGEKVRIHLDEPYNRQDRFWTGEVTDVLESSPLRVEPAWKLAGPLAQGGGVGGADLIHVSLKGQHEWKKSVIDQQMLRLGGVESDVQIHAAPGDDQLGGLHWRTRIEMIADENGMPSMRRRESHHRVPITDMPLATEELLGIARQENVWNGGFAPSSQIRLAVPALHGSEHRGNNYALYANGKLQAGQAVLTESVPGVQIGSQQRTLRYHVSAQGFWQVHRRAPELLINQVLLDAQQQISSVPRTIWDLYSGSGLFAMALGLLAGRGGNGLFTVEGSSVAVRSARANLRHAGLGAAQVKCGSVERVLRSIPSRFLHPDLVVLDPARAGAKKTVIHQIAEAGAHVVIYVACSPTSLARDTATLIEEGYRPVDLQAFDIYPMTHHVETIATFVQTREARRRAA